MSKISKSEAMAMAWNIHQVAKTLMAHRNEMLARHKDIPSIVKQSDKMWRCAEQMRSFALEIERKHGIEQSAMEADT